MLEHRKGQAQQPHRLGIVLDPGTADEFAQQKHLREPRGILGHVLPAAHARVPNLSCESPKFRMIGQTLATPIFWSVQHRHVSLLLKFAQESSPRIEPPPSPGAGRLCAACHVVLPERLDAASFERFT